MEKSSSNHDAFKQAALGQPKTHSKDPELTVRLIKSSENRSAELVQVSESAFEYSLAWEADFFRNLIAQDHVLAMVAEIKGKITGFLLVGISLDEAEVYNIAVSKEFKRRGIASAMMTECKRQLGVNGVRKLFLEVRASNTPAQSFYKGQGFELVGARKNYYKNPDEDALVLKCDL